MTPARAPVIQRKCACGGGACDSCSEKKEPRLQRSALSAAPSNAVPAAAVAAMRGPGRPLDSATRASLEPRFGRSFADVRVHDDAASARAATSIHAAAYTSGSHIVFGSGRYEPHTDRGRRLLAHELTHVVQQQSGAAGEDGMGAAEDAHEQEANRVADSVAAPSAPQRWIVEDDAQPAPGQMRRTEFLDALHPAICAAADAAMARLGRSTEGCPVIARYQTFARARSAAQLESAARRYASEAASVRSAREYIPIVARRVTQGVADWGRSGVIPEIPPELGMGGLGRIRVGVGSLVSGLLGGVHFKARDGGANTLACPWLGLGGGRPLDSGIASRMEGALGASFSGVRVHTGSEAASAASSANARAFTIGRDIAFGAGEYRPGTMVGDALLAHELAHVAQQNGAPAGVLMKAEDAQNGVLEEDADNAAVGAVVSLWGRSKQLARQSGARLKSGLRLSRCKNNPPPRASLGLRSGSTQAGAAACSTPDARNAGASCCTTPMLAEIATAHTWAIDRTSHAIDILTRRGGPSAAVQPLLLQHFHFAPTDATHLNAVVSYYRRMKAQMLGSGITFRCQDAADGPCRGNAAYSTSCGQTPQVVTFCGDYPPTGTGTYLTGGAERWGRTVIHEYTHLTCGVGRGVDEMLSDLRATPGTPVPPEMAAGGSSYAGGMENYRHDPNAPRGPEAENPRYTNMTAEQAVHQPDPYAQFAADAWAVD